LTPEKYKCATYKLLAHYLGKVSAKHVIFPLYSTMTSIKQLIFQ